MYYVKIIPVLYNMNEELIDDTESKYTYFTDTVKDTVSIFYYKRYCKRYCK